MNGQSNQAQQTNCDADRSINLAIAAFENARGEILKRLEIRERLIEVYVLASLAILGALATIYGQDGSPRQEFFLLPPMLALAVSFRLRSHVDSTEAVAEFIRRDLNAFFIKSDSWAPYWDWATHADFRVNKSGRYGGIKKSRRFISESMSLHFPCFFSMSYLFYATKMESSFETRWSVFVFFFGILMFIVAFENTRRSYRDREVTKSHLAKSPLWWKETIRTASEDTK